MSLPNKAKSFYSISRQLASQYDRKRQDVESKALTILYSPFEPLTKRKLDEIIEFTEKLLADQEFNELILFSKEIIDLSLAGLKYYHDYYQRPLLFTVTLSFLGWIAYLLKVLSEQKVNSQAEASNKNKYTNSSKLLNSGFKTIFLLLCSVACFLIYGE